MKDITHEILSEVHYLLSIATAEELQRTANLPNTSPNLRGALKLLAAEKASTSRRGVAGALASRVSRKSAGGEELGAKSKLNALARDLMKSFEKLDKGEIQEVCIAFGVPLSVNAKDARERIIRRVAISLLRMPENQRERILSAMQTNADTQTEGWVGVIRKGQ